LCKTWTAVSDSRLIVANARILLSIELNKNLCFCKVQGSYVPNLVKIGPCIRSQSCPQTPDGRYISSNAMHCIGQTIIDCNLKEYQILIIFGLNTCIPVVPTVIFRPSHHTVYSPGPII